MSSELSGEVRSSCICVSVKMTSIIEDQVKCFVSSLAAKVSFNVESEGVVWGKSLELMPTVTIKEVNAHRANAGKNGEIIAKTLDRGKKFK